ncbi:MAG: aldo/keto reductase [Sphaerochaetaceae bacterium]|nr:aldo/keto reductase [Sphaerochaetaceae bacterium]
MVSRQLGVKQNVFPIIGFGTSEFESDDQVRSCVGIAIETGYRLIDTASIYGSEKGIGEAVRDAIATGVIKREDIWISSKVANADQGYDRAKIAFEHTMENLGLDFLDLYLIHWPIPKDKQDCYQALNAETWRAMIDLKEQGLIKEIGVCNFLPRHIRNLVDTTGILPFVNQLEIHPRYQQIETVNWCQERNIIVEAWCPFRHGKILNEPLLMQLAAKYGVSVSELCLKWDMQNDIVPLPKTKNFDRIKVNFDTVNLDFCIDSDDLELIRGLDRADGHEDYWNYKRQLSF